MALGVAAIGVRTELWSPTVIDSSGKISGQLFAAADGANWQAGNNNYNRVMTLHGLIMVFLVIVPSVPASLGNFLVAAFKDAPLGFILPVPGLLFFANTVRGEDFRVTEPYLLAGVGFLLISIPAAWLVRRLEERITYERT